MRNCFSSSMSWMMSRIETTPVTRPSSSTRRWRVVVVAHERRAIHLARARGDVRYAGPHRLADGQAAVAAAREHGHDEVALGHEPDDALAATLHADGADPPVRHELSRLADGGRAVERHHVSRHVFLDRGHASFLLAGLRRP